MKKVKISAGKIALAAVVFILGLGLRVSPLYPILKAIGVIGWTTAEAANNPNNVVFAPNIATVEALGPASAFYQVVQVLGYNANGDWGGGTLSWSSASTTTADSCVTFPATGVTTGRWIRQLYGVPLSVEDCGAFHDNSNATATLAAFQAANNYVEASVNKNAEIWAKGPLYNFGSGATGVVKASSFYGPQWVGGGASEGGNGTIVTYTPSAEGASFDFIGGSGAICRCGVKGIAFEGNANTIAVEADGQDGMDIDISTIGTMERGVLLNNLLSGQFTEQDKINLNSNGGLVTALEYRVGAGSPSFNGSGLVGGTINYAGGASPAVLVNTGAFPYNAPMSAEFFPAAGSAVGIKVANITAFGAPWFYGNLRAEVNASFTWGSTSEFLFNGTLSSAGVVTNGTLYQTTSLQSELTSLRALWFQPINYTGVTVAGGTTTIPWPDNVGNQNWQILVEVAGASYDAQATAGLWQEAGFTGFTVVNQQNVLTFNGAGYGNIVIAANTSTGISLSATSTAYPAGLTYYITITQIGQGVLNHSSQ